MVWTGIFSCLESCWKVTLLNTSVFHGLGKAKEAMAERRVVGILQEITLGSGTGSQNDGGLAGLCLLSPTEHLPGSCYPRTHKLWETNVQVLNVI